MKIENFVIGMIGTNCYLVSDEETRECLLVDAAEYSQKLVSHIRESGFRLQAILLTHGHFDHVMGIDGYVKEFDVPVYAHEEEAALLNDASLNVSAMYGSGYTFSNAVYVKDGQVLELIGKKWKILYTPGHTVGGCCYYCEEEKVLFSGDTLFCASIGRTDLPTGSAGTLVRSVREKLFVLPGQTRVLPGHMEETTIEYEKRHNPFV